MRNILVTGANGQLGNELRLVTSQCTSGDKYIFTDVTDASEESIAMLHKIGGANIDISTRRLDITDLNAIRKMVKDEQVSIIINCAAYTNVDTAEDNEQLAELLNAKAPENLAIAMKEVAGGLLIHISTDYVFGKEPYNTPCKEDQKGTPTGVYGLTKLHGEQAIERVGCDYVIIRTAWLYSEFGKNFVKTMLNLTATKPQLKVVFDQVGTPTYARDLAEIIYKMVDERTAYKNVGTCHFSNEGVCSWYDFTKMIAEYAGNTGCDIQPCHTDEFPSKVKRPAFSVLDKTKIKETFGIEVPYWTDSLKKCMSNM
jgi:dTDP-4-dehydrorhamnose reductase